MSYRYQEFLLKVLAGVLMITLAAIILTVIFGCSRGETGPTGATGAKGPVVPVYTFIASPVACPNGGVVLVVGSGVNTLCNGATGAVGGIGPTGPQGLPGQDLTPISIVQFCPNTTVYPATFTEVGFCISGNLYAVYSDHGGFATYIPPGVYSSNGINSSCTFTVGDNCEISN